MVGTPRKDRHRPSVLFALSHVGYLRNFERTILELSDAGFDVHVAFGQEHERIRTTDYEDRLLSRIHIHPVEPEPELPADPMAFLRLFRDTMFFARKEFVSAQFLRKRFLETKTVRKLVTSKMLSALEALPAPDRLLIDDLLARIDASHPPSRIVADLVGRIRPDVVVVSPYLMLFSREVEFAKVARKRGIPLIYAAASWDNLTTKNVIKVQPDIVAVWNEAMADEAVTLHRVEREHIRITGAPVFDWWFDEQQAWDRQTFLRKAGFGDDRPVLLYVCSSSAVGSNEAAVAERWAQAVRSSPDTLVRGANILIRPHPVAIDLWREQLGAQAEPGARPDYRVFPDQVSYPTNADDRASFFNSLYHAAAIIGLNTSAMIEAAILDKPVLTFKGHDSEDSQVGNLHFKHLAESGCVHVAETMDGLLTALSECLAAPQEKSGAREAFVHSFVRPQGPDKAPSKILADLIAGQLRADRDGRASARGGWLGFRKLRAALPGKRKAYPPRLSGGDAAAQATTATEVPEHWKNAGWEEMAKENPLLAIMSTASFREADPREFSPQQLEELFAKGKKLFNHHVKPALRDIPPSDETLIVEYGCGAGRILRSVANRGYRCAGIDISAAMLEHCRRLVPEADLFPLDNEGKSALPNGSAALVYSYSVLQHIASLRVFSGAVDEVCRILRPGGTLLLQVNCCDFEGGDPTRPWRTENYEDHSLHFRAGETEPLFRHPQDHWSGVYVGYSRLVDMLATHKVRAERWYHHSSSKLRAVWVVAQKTA
jgi:SAM-dependent methyltransferase